MKHDEMSTQRLPRRASRRRTAPVRASPPTTPSGDAAGQADREAAAASEKEPTDPDKVQGIGQHQQEEPEEELEDLEEDELALEVTEDEEEGALEPGMLGEEELEELPEEVELLEEAQQEAEQVEEEEEEEAEELREFAEEEEAELEREDAEATLEEILREQLGAPALEEEEEAERRRRRRAAPQVEEEQVRPRSAEEFLCQSCFLVKHRRQLADPVRLICVDCANSGH